MNDYDQKRLELGRSLRQTPTLIECRAYITYAGGDISNPEWQPAYIPPGAVNDKGYVEEVWIVLNSLSIEKKEVNGEEHLVLSPDWLTDTRAKVKSFEVYENKPYLLPSPDLSVKYRIDPQPELDS